jgi:hypothetical protein
MTQHRSGKSKTFATNQLKKIVLEAEILFGNIPILIVYGFEGMPPLPGVI